MKINLMPYIQKALERAGYPADLSTVRVAVALEFTPDASRNAAVLYTRLEVADDAGRCFRKALKGAGMDDLRVFELGRAFDNTFQEAGRV